jgi:uncharacterized protein DUF2752
MTATPGATSTLATRLRPPVAVALAGAALGSALLVRDPHASGSWGYCPFLLLTGVPCPGCGGLRATSDLLHGRLADAMGSNLYAVATVALAALVFAAWTAAAAAGRRLPLQGHVPRVLVVWFAGLVVFGLLRLLPGLSALRP